MTPDLQTYLRTAAAQGRERRRAGCFEVFLNPLRDGAGTNYAIPLDGCVPTDGDVAALVAAFESAHRMPRLEYLPGTAPAAKAVLLAHGFEIELRTPVMTCTPDRLRAAGSPAVIERLDALAPPEVVRELVRVQQVAFGEEPTDDHDGLLRLPMAVTARMDGQIVGGGMALVIANGTTELVGIAVAETHRRRGIAGAITAELARMAFEHGAASAFLTPGDAGARRVYARAGFAETDVMLHLRRPTTPPAPPR